MFQTTNNENLKYPLVVDLDDCLINTDLLYESTLNLFGQSIFVVFNMFLWLLKGKAFLKAKLATLVNCNPQTLPYNQELLLWLKEQHTLGRKLILCTASNIIFANKISEHLGLFDEVIASDEIHNLSGKNKALALVERFGKKGFDYAGNSKKDLFVWEVSRKAIVVNASQRVATKAQNICAIEKIFPKAVIGFTGMRRTLRMHQWLKNLLLFTPLIASHQIINFELWLPLIIACLAFSFCASSVYIANDLLDLESDRQHPRKKQRPFASGLVPIVNGVILAPILFILSIILAMFVGQEFLFCLTAYFLLTVTYSLFLKKLVLIDCITLAILYLVRIISGATVMQVSLSFWLLAFAAFLFLSLAFVKRYSELLLYANQSKNKQEKIHGRGYLLADHQLIEFMGIISGYLSVLVLALYLNSPDILNLYNSPEIVWCAVPVLLFWISWVFLKAHRGEMNDDPLVFAIKDFASLISGFIFALILFIGAIGI